MKQRAIYFGGNVSAVFHALYCATKPLWKLQRWEKNSLGFVLGRVFFFWKSNRRLLGTVIFTRDPYFRFPLGLYCQRRALLPPPNICAQCTRTGALGTVYVTQLKSRYLRIQRKEKAHTPFPISFVFFRLDIVVVWSLRCRRTRSAYAESQSP